MSSKMTDIANLCQNLSNTFKDLGSIKTKF